MKYQKCELSQFIVSVMMLRIQYWLLGSNVLVMIPLIVDDTKSVKKLKYHQQYHQLSEVSALNTYQKYHQLSELYH